MLFAFRRPFHHWVHPQNYNKRSFYIENTPLSYLGPFEEIESVVYGATGVKSIKGDVLLGIGSKVFYSLNPASPYVFACTSIHPSIHLSMHACMHPSIHACMHACMHAYIHPCINTYISASSYRSKVLHQARKYPFFALSPRQRTLKP